MTMARWGLNVAFVEVNEPMLRLCWKMSCWERLDTWAIRFGVWTFEGCFKALMFQILISLSSCSQDIAYSWNVPEMVGWMVRWREWTEMWLEIMLVEFLTSNVAFERILDLIALSYFIHLMKNGINRAMNFGKKWLTYCYFAPEFMFSLQKEMHLTGHSCNWGRVWENWKVKKCWKNWWKVGKC